MHLFHFPLVFMFMAMASFFHLFASSSSTSCHSTRLCSFNLLTFRHLQHVTTESMHDMAWLTEWWSQHQTTEEENESDERATHQTMLFTVRLLIVHAHSVPTRRESQRTLTLCSRAITSPPAKKMTQTTDLPSATALPAAATGTTSTSAATPAAAADNCCEVWCVWSGNETASHLSRAATLVSVPLVSTESSVWAPAARFVALISRWWRASVTKHCSYYNECSFFKWHWLPSEPLFVIFLLCNNFYLTKNLIILCIILT